MKILIVEDEVDVATALGRVLSREGYSVDLAATGDCALEFLEVVDYDLLVLDLNLPDIDGLVLCRQTRMRWPRLLILILTARRDIKDVVSGLDQGADDYLTKPFHLEEIQARIRALLRRDMRCRDPLLRIRDISLDSVEHVVWQSGRRINLSRKEFGVLEYLMRHADEVISQEELLEHVWNSEIDEFSNTVRVHVLSLRRKLQERTSEWEYISTIVGSGYRFNRTESREDEHA